MEIKRSSPGEGGFMLGARQKVLVYKIAHIRDFSVVCFMKAKCFQQISAGILET
jgi:hypothetical protein